MSIRDRARQFVLDYNVRDIFHSREAPTEELVDIIEQAIVDEREACAKLCDDHDCSDFCGCEQLTAAILARGKEAT